MGRDPRLVDDTVSDIIDIKVLDLTRAQWKNILNVRLPSGERFEEHCSRRKHERLSKKDARFLLNRIRPKLSLVRGAAARGEELFSSSSRADLLKFHRVWVAVDSCMTLAFPFETKQVTCFRVKWFVRLAEEVVRYHSTHPAAKLWKGFSKFLLLHFGGAITPEPVWDQTWPSLPEGTWMAKPPGELTRAESAHWACMISTRTLPPGDRLAAEEALEAHAKALCDRAPPSAADLALLYEYSRKAAAQIRTWIPEGFWARRTGHISISNSGCYEAARSAGGRRQYLLETLEEWLTEPVLTSRSVLLPTGEVFIEEEGVTRQHSVRPAGMDPPSPTRYKVDSGIFTEDFPATEQERVGFQLLSWSFVTLLDEGYIDREGFPTGKPLPVTRETIGEPGSKIRVVTKSMAAYVTYGQPWGHLMKEILEFDPSLKAGLRSGAQGFEWLKQLQRCKYQHTPKFIMVGDFEAATDHIEHLSGKTAIRAFCDELGLSSNYVRGYGELLCSARLIERAEGVWDTSSCGSLMGEPGTKFLLTFLAKVANIYTHLGFASDCFATAGDDQIDGSDDAKLLMHYAEASRITSMKPSVDKWGVFSLRTLYCQQLLLCGEAIDRAEIAVPKVRLLSTEQKTGKGDDDVNPAFGKAKQFHNEARYAEFPSLTRSMVFIFLRNMHQYIEYRPETFLPREWGGLGLPGISMKSLWSRLTDERKCIIQQREENCGLSSKILARWSSSKNFERGIILEDHSAEITYEELIRSFAPGVYDIPSDVKIPEKAGFREVERLMNKAGWHRLDEIVSKIISSSQYQQYWRPGSKPDRGYSNLSWSTRDARLSQAYEKIRTIQVPRVEPYENPRFSPAYWVFAEAVYPLTTEHAITEDSEPGEVHERNVPILGPGLSGPRVFLHYSNHRLTRHAGRSSHH